MVVVVCARQGRPRQVDRSDSARRDRSRRPRQADRNAVGRGRHKSTPPQQRKRKRSNLRPFVVAGRAGMGNALRRSRHGSYEVCTAADVAACERWIEDFALSGENAVGLDIEWKPNTRKRQREHPAATLQLATGSRCLVVQLLRFDSATSPALCTMLSDPSITKVGVGVRDDVRKLQRDHDLRCAGAIDLSDFFKEVTGLDGRGGGASPGTPAADPRANPARFRVKEAIGLKRLAKYVLRFDLTKSRHLATSDWSAVRLTGKQLEYAALDAVVACRIYDELRRLRRLPGPGGEFARRKLTGRAVRLIRFGFLARRVKALPVLARLVACAGAWALLCSPPWAACALVGGTSKAAGIAGTPIASGGLGEGGAGVVRAIARAWTAAAALVVARAWGEEGRKRSRPLLRWMDGPSRWGGEEPPKGKVRVRKFSAGLTAGAALSCVGIGLLGLPMRGGIFWAVLAAPSLEICLRGCAEEELEREWGAGRAWVALACGWALARAAIPSPCLGRVPLSHVGGWGGMGGEAAAQAAMVAALSLGLSWSKRRTGGSLWFALGARIGLGALAFS